MNKRVTAHLPELGISDILAHLVLRVMLGYLGKERVDTNHLTQLVDTGTMGQLIDNIELS